ncbi:nuclear transport factor 2 family protein [Pseudonocardia humida]|uniref:Nuclear transport factor 2 family protein n=1 Tax=Pseudonocardia humida TaxID=2800819 RepID=A0ABT1A0Z7_9PSEU|nr:nuclear transport factor 2 family protein [Pseudonocardia humida]MCO1656672.1 nuclear transport factor 2 family protein [Pseudonocardia humida]
MATPPVVPALYAALRAADVPALLATLHTDFRGRVTDGLPFGIGGAADGPQEMLRDVWARASAHYDALRPEPDEYSPTADGRVLVLGWYTGTARAGGRPLRARFAHVIRVRDGLVAELEQITDSARWWSAAGATPASAPA